MAFLVRKATLEAEFSVQKSNHGAGIFGSKSIFSLNECHAGDELEGLQWSIEFKVSQSVQGLEDDSVKGIETVSDS